VLASTFSVPSTFTTFIRVQRWISSVRMLSWSGDRWITTTKASPDWGGMVVKNACRASMLPAEPPRPTTGTFL
jgi:hypothetical protein